MCLFFILQATAEDVNVNVVSPNKIESTSNLAVSNDKPSNIPVQINTQSDEGVLGIQTPGVTSIPKPTYVGGGGGPTFTRFIEDIFQVSYKTYYR